eukprot:98335-Amorphochlora_amoeboformis.AAC.1
MTADIFLGCVAKTISLEKREPSNSAGKRVSGGQQEPKATCHFARESSSQRMRISVAILRPTNQKLAALQVTKLPASAPPVDLTTIMSQKSSQQAKQ